VTQIPGLVGRPRRDSWSVGRREASAPHGAVLADWLWLPPAAASNRVGAGLTPAPPTPPACGSAPGGSLSIPGSGVGVGEPFQAHGLVPVGVRQRPLECQTQRHASTLLRRRP